MIDAASLLPPNATVLERAVEQAVARIGDVPVMLRTLWNPATCPEALLPYLAWGLSIDTWDATWPIEVRRARVAQAIEVQRHKGTVAAVRSVVAAFGGAIALREWWQQDPPGEPYTFSLTLSVAKLDGTAPTAAFVDQIVDEVTRTKPARAHFTLTQALKAAGAVGVVGTARAVVFARLSLAAA